MDIFKTNQGISTNTMFEIVEGSNYEVIMTYETIEIITFEHFMKLSKVLFNSAIEFVTINQVIVKRLDIKMVKPTTKRTKKQQLAIDERRKLQAERDAIETKKRDKETTKFLEFSNNWLKNKLGKDGNYKDRLKYGAEIMKEYNSLRK